MLNVEALDSALTLTQILDEHNIVLTPIEGTPLDTLVKATRSDARIAFSSTEKTSGVPGVKVEGVGSPNVKMITYMANAKNEAFGTSAHDEVLDNTTLLVTEAVKRYILFAKTVVAPAVADLVSRVHRELSLTMPSSLLGMEVITYSPPAPLLNSALEKSVRRFEEEPFNTPPLAMKLPLITVEEMLKLMKTGTKNLNDAIDEWASVKGDSFFIRIWTHVFQIKQAELSEKQQLRFNTFTECPAEGVDNALAIYLLANALADKPLPETTMGLNAFNNLIVEYRNQAGSRLCRAIDDHDSSSKNKILVKSVQGTKTIVNSDVYSKWIQDGGENEILFGNTLTGVPVCTVSSINDKAIELKTLWARHSSITSVTESNRRFTRTKHILTKEFDRQLRDLDEVKEPLPDSRDNIVRRFSKMLEAARESELDDLWDLCLRLVCNARFFHTDAERILSGIERIKKENPTIDVREAAAVSVLEYIAYWVSTQFRVTVLK
jgi:hypothetical protein